MATALQQVQDTQRAKRTFAEVIAELQAGQKMQARPAVHLRSVPMAAPEPPPSIVLPQAVSTKAMDMQRRQHALVSHVNRTMPEGCHVLAWSIVPKQVFDTELGRFLMMAYGYYASGPENTLLLPATAKGVSFLALPRHPLATAESHIADATLRIDHLRQTVISDHQRTLQALRHGDVSELYQTSERHAQDRQKLSDIACDIAETAFGESIWEAHETRFRKLIQSL
jgi:hypothetical protein